MCAKRRLPALSGSQPVTLEETDGARLEKSYPSGVRWDLHYHLRCRSKAYLKPRRPGGQTEQGSISTIVHLLIANYMISQQESQRVCRRSVLRPGVHVGLHLPNTPHFTAFLQCSWQAGGSINFSPLAAPRELKYQLTDAETEVMVAFGLPMLYPRSGS